MGDIELLFPTKGICAPARLLAEEAPLTCDFIWRSLDTPVEARTLHAKWSGCEVFFYLPEGSDPPPVENHSIHPRPGELMFFHMPRNRLQGVRNLTYLPTHDVFEVALFYGDSSLRHHMELGWRGNVFAELTGNREAVFKACEDIYLNGSCPVILRRRA